LPQPVPLTAPADSVAAYPLRARRRFRAYVPSLVGPAVVELLKPLARAALRVCLVYLVVAGWTARGVAWWEDPCYGAPPGVVAHPGGSIWNGPARLADLRGSSVSLWYTRSRDGEEGKGGIMFLPVPLLRSRLFEPGLIGVVARDVGVDPALAAAIVAVESAFNPRAVSPTGARGLMQLTSRTARSVGVYNRFSPRWNLKGGMRYLKSLLAMFGGNVPLAVAAYTLGPTGVERELGRDPDRAAAHPYVQKVLSARERYRKGIRAAPARGGHVVAVGGSVRSGLSEADGVVGWGYRLHSLLAVGAAGRFPHGQPPLWLLSSHACLLDYLEGMVTWRAGTEEFEVSGAVVSGNGKVRLIAEADWEGNIRGGLSLAPVGSLDLWGWVGEQEAAAGAQLAVGKLRGRYAVEAREWKWGEDPLQEWHSVGVGLGL
jgi:soluble lytic murein transglycosylase-like protein